MKQLLLTLFSVVFATSLTAQNWQIGLEYQYGFGYPTQRYDHIYDHINMYVSNVNLKFTDKQAFTFGQGNKFGINAGYTWRGGWSAGLSVNYFLGATIKQEQTKFDVYGFGDQDYYTMNFEYSGKYMSIEPTVTKYFGWKKRGAKWHPYITASGIVSFNQIDLEVLRTWDEEFFGVETVLGNREFTGRQGFGGAIGLGVAYEISSHFLVQLAARFTYLTYAPKKNQLTSYIYTNYFGEQEDLLETRQNDFPYFYSTEYFPKGEVPEQTEQSPTYMEYQYAPFSSIGLQIGVVYSFGRL